MLPGAPPCAGGSMSRSMTFSGLDRPAHLERLCSETFDVLVVGGGITGAGILWEATARGLRAALVERGDFATGTSSRSSKLIHGGLRYLEQGDVGLVFESVRERQRLMRRAPHLARPLSFVLPVWQKSKRGLLTMDLGLTVYDLLGAFGGVIRHKTHRAPKLREIEPSLSTDGLRGGIVYVDAMTDDARLVLANVRAAVSAGGLAVPRCEFLAPIMADEEGVSRLRGATVRDVRTGRKIAVRTSCVINAGGPFTDELLDRFGDRPVREGEDEPFSGPLMRASKGVHLVVPRERLPVGNAVVMSAPDGRVVFALPWEEATAIGTTDTPYDGPLETPVATTDDVSYLLETTNRHFDLEACGGALQMRDVRSTWAGIRPLVAGSRDDAASTYRTSREHAILVGNGHVSIAGGKLTTFRLMAAEAVDAAAPFLRPDARAESGLARALLPGAAGIGAGKGALDVFAAKLAQEADITPELAVHLARRYGSEARDVVLCAREDPDGLDPVAPGCSSIWGELRFAVTYEMALDLDDFLVRRTHIFFLAEDQGRAVAPQVARRLCDWLSESESVFVHRLECYLSLIDQSARFRLPPRMRAGTSKVRAAAPVVAESPT